MFVDPAGAWISKYTPTGLHMWSFFWLTGCLPYASGIWHDLWLRVGMKKDMSYDVIGLYAENIDTVLGSIVSTDGYLITQSERISSLGFLYDFFHSTMILKLRMTICMIARRQFLIAYSMSIIIHWVRSALMYTSWCMMHGFHGMSKPWRDWAMCSKFQTPFPSSHFNIVAKTYVITWRERERERELLDLM